MKENDLKVIEAHTVEIRQLVMQMALDEFGIIVKPERITVQTWWDELGLKRMFRALFTMATIEETIAEIPADWWHHFKQRWFSGRKWLRYCPIWLRVALKPKMMWVVAQHKFPELEVPNEVMGREFVHLKVVELPKVDEG